MEFLHPAMWHNHDIDFARGLHPAMWHLALESWQWIYQVAAPCNVIRGSGMTCLWIRPVAAPCNVTGGSGIMTLNSPGGSTLQCGWWLWDDMPLNSPKRPPHWNSTFCFDFDHITAVDMSFCTNLWNFLPNRTTVGRKRMTSWWFLRWRISAILDFRDPIMGSLNDEFMRCGSSKRKERIKFIKKNSKRYGEGGKRKRTRDTENWYFWMR